MPVFADALNGFLVGGAGGDRLYATHDGGRTWHQVELPDPKGMTIADGGGLVDARFFSPTEGLLLRMIPGSLSAQPLVYRTSDAGHTWTIVPTPVVAGSNGECALVASDAWTCFAAGNATGHVWREGKEDWTAFPIVGLPADAQMTFLDADHGWALDAQADSGALYVTTDGGVTWQRVVPGP